MLRFDADLASGSAWAAATITKAALTAGQFNFDDLVAINLSGATAGRQVRRITREDPNNSALVIVVLNGTGSDTADTLSSALNAVVTSSFPIVDNFIDGGALGSIEGFMLLGD